jgi:hypothetical protein
MSLTKYVMLRSSLGLNPPLGILNQDTTYSRGQSTMLR